MDLYAVIGNPISHSISPYIHNAAFKKRKINAFYIPIEIPYSNLKAGIDALKTLNFSGFNVTIPFKEEMIELLDEVDEKVLQIQAVNTVKKEDDKLVGYNTDWYGFLKVLEEENIEVYNKNIVIIGAGGAAKAVLSTLFDLSPQKIIILNRTLSRANELIENYKNLITNHQISAHQLNSPDIQKIIQEGDIIINCTPIGLKDNESPIYIEGSMKGKVVIDLIYNPLTTIFLKRAKEKGARIINGLGMLVYQACGSFEIWTGKKAPVTTMKRAAQRALIKSIVDS